MNEFTDYEDQLPEPNREVIVSNGVAQYEANSSNIKYDESVDTEYKRKQWYGKAHGGINVYGMFEWKYNDNQHSHIK